MNALTLGSQSSRRKAFSSFIDSHCSILSIFQLGYFPVGRKRERVTTRRERTRSGDEKAIRSTWQSVVASDKSSVDMTSPHKSLSLFIAHQTADLRDRSHRESLYSTQTWRSRTSLPHHLHAQAGRQNCPD